MWDTGGLIEVIGKDDKNRQSGADKI